MNQHWEQIQQAIDAALTEVAAAEAMQLIPGEAEQHWRCALNYFLRCVEVCGHQREQARKRLPSKERGDLW